MRLLPSVKPTPEQIPILAYTAPGFALIRGAAGSGKTTAALLRLRQLCATRLSRRDRLGETEPVRVLVLTYNRTLEGYVAELAREQVPHSPGLILRVNTFGKWATDVVGYSPVAKPGMLAGRIKRLGIGINLEPDFLVSEVEYVLGRFQPSDLNRYLTAKREGRGLSPRVDKEMREKIVVDVILPYADWKINEGVRDWHDLASDAAALGGRSPAWDVVIVDESQDFSANQVRAVLGHLTDDHSTTFIIDATQRIYPRYFAWSEVGIKFPPAGAFRLRKNYRNTRQIAALARNMVLDLPQDDDGMLPDFEACDRDGAVPKVIIGRYALQVSYALRFIEENVAMPDESVAFLHAKGGAWFDYLRDRLRAEGIQWCELARADMWPSGSESVALCTIHSAKGLEFDHVFLIGLNGEVTPHGKEEGDDAEAAVRRLIAMGVGRAIKTVTIGYKPDDPPRVFDWLPEATFSKVAL